MVTHPDDLFNTKGSYLQLLPEDVKNRVARFVTHEQYLNEKIISHLGIELLCNRYEIIDRLPAEFIPRSKILDPTFLAHYIGGRKYLNFVFKGTDNFKNILLPKHNNDKIDVVELSPDNQSIIIFTSYTVEVDKKKEKRYSTYIFDHKKLRTFQNTVDAVILQDRAHVVTVAHQPYSNSFFCVRSVQIGLNIASLKFPTKYPPFDAVELFFDESGQNVGLVATTVTRMQIFFRWNLAELLAKEQKLKLLTERDQALLLSYLVKMKKDSTVVTDAEIDTFVKPLDNKIKKDGSLLAKALKNMAANRGQLLKKNTQVSNFVASDTEASP